MLKPRSRYGRWHPRRDARPRACLERCRPSGGDVPRAHRRGGTDRGAAHQPEAPVHARAPVGGPEVEEMEQQILTGEAPDPTRIPSGLPLPSTLPGRRVGRGRAARHPRALPGRGPADDARLPRCAQPRRRRRDRMTETLPYSWYTDPEVLAQERARLFSSAWQYAATAASSLSRARTDAARRGGRCGRPRPRRRCAPS